MHAACSDCARYPACSPFYGSIDACNQRKHPGVRIDARVLVVKAVDIGKINQDISIHEMRDHGRKRIVVAEFNFLYNHGIVFVDDWKYIPP